jgi:peptidoglycan/LPS O-acetylase OafA/YrhL
MLKYNFIWYPQSLFFKDSKLKLIVILYFLYIFTSVTVLLNIQSRILDLANKYLAILGAVHFGWFAIGIYTYIYLQKKQLKIMFLLLVLCCTNVLHSTKYNFNPALIIILILLILIWFRPIIYLSFRRFLSSRILLFFGFISYPLYLLHQNFVTGMVIKFYNLGVDIPNFLFPLFFLIPTILVSFLISKSEPLIVVQLSEKFYGR